MTRRTSTLRSMLFGVRAALPVALLVVLSGCVERRLWVRTEPEGAHVRINGNDVGVSPVAWRFDHYGTVLVEAELDGHEPVQRKVRLDPPWWQRPGADFFADVVIPATFRDDHEVRFELEPARKPSAEDLDRQVRRLAARARKLRAEAETR